MKLSREDALAILEVEEDATMDLIRKAYLSKSREWHPDKHPEEEREAATEEFKKIGGAYAKLQKDEESSDEEEDDDEGDYDFTDINDMYEMFFAAMGVRPGARGGTFFFPTADGGFATHVHSGRQGGGGSGHPVRRPQQCPQCGGYHYDGEHDSEEDSDYDSQDSHDSEWYRQRNEDYLRAQEQTLEQLRRDREAEEAKKLARSRERWTEALARPALIGATDTQLHIRGDARGTRMARFPGGTPPGFTLEVQYRRVTGGSGGSGDTQPYSVVLGGRALRRDTRLDVVIPGLDPGNNYYVKTRGCCAEEEGEGVIGAWSVESKFSTKGSQKAASSKFTSAPAAPAAAAPPGQGKKARRKAKQAAAAEQSGAPGGQEVDEAAAAAAAQLEKEAAAKQREKEAAIKAAMEAAAADYERTAAKVKAAAERAAAKKAAAAQSAAPPAAAAAPSSSAASASSKLQQLQATSEAEAAQSKKNRKKNKAGAKQHFDSTANGTASPMPAHHQPQPQQPAQPGTFGSQPAMMAPTQRNFSLLTEKQKQEAANLGLSPEEYAQCLRAEMELGINAGGGGGGGGAVEEEEEEDSLWSDAGVKAVPVTRASTGISAGAGAGNGAGGYTAEQVQLRQQRQYEEFQKQRQLQNNTARREQQEQEARHASPAARGFTDFSKPVAAPVAAAAPAAAAAAPARPSRVAPAPAASPAPPPPLPPHFFMPMHPAAQAPRPQPRPAPAPAPAPAAAYARAPAPAPAPASLPAVAPPPSAPKFLQSPKKAQPKSPDPSLLPSFNGLPTLPDSLFQEPWSTTAPALQQQQPQAQPGYGQQAQHAQQQHVPPHVPPQQIPQHHQEQQQPGQSSFFGSLPEDLEDSLDSAPAYQDLLPSFLYEAE